MWRSCSWNALIGEDRYIVTDIAGTTRDSIDTKYNRFGFDFNLVDTAGIRKKSKVKEDLEFYSVMRAVRTIEYSDVAILMVDATRGFESQDQNIFWLADKNRKGVIILINKWWSPLVPQLFIILFMGKSVVLCDYFIVNTDHLAT